jgi:anti-sigma-K factor RskA
MNHTEFEQLVAGYVLGALEPDDESAFQRHLEGCAACEANVRELEEVVGALAYSATPVDPPASLKASIRREVAATARPRPARPAVQDIGAARRGRARPSRRRWSAGTLVGRLAVAASIIALIALGFWNLSLRDQNDLYRQRVAAFEQAGRLLNDDTAQTVALKGTAGRATALVSSREDRGVLVVENLPALRRGRVYEVWGIPAGATLERAIPAGVFRASSGVSVATFKVPIQPRMAFGVTDEPGPTGSAHPTTEPVLVGTSA